VQTRRRLLLKSAFAAFIAAPLGCSPVAPRPAPSPTPPPRKDPVPDPALFETGDFIWPKKPGAYVPYFSGGASSPDADRAQWTRERDQYLASLTPEALRDPLARERAEQLRTMDFREFYAIYAGDQEPGKPGVYSGSGLYVGHVAIIELAADKTPWVIEAVVPRLRRISYADWLAHRPGEYVWLARLRDRDAASRARVASEARKYADVGRPYDFWNFDLNDDSGFYCSKLAWLSIYRALGFAVDGKPNSNRRFWFSPKQLLNLRATIQKLNDPETYIVNA